MTAKKWDLYIDASKWFANGTTEISFKNITPVTPGMPALDVTFFKDGRLGINLAKEPKPA